LKPWDVIDSPVLAEMDDFRFLHAGGPLSNSSKPPGFVKRLSENEKHKANLKKLAKDAGFTKTVKTKSPPPSAAVLPRRGAAVSERWPGLFALMYPEVFPTGSEDFNPERKVKVLLWKHLEWANFKTRVHSFSRMAGALRPDRRSRLRPLLESRGCGFVPPPPRNRVPIHDALERQANGDGGDRLGCSLSALLPRYDSPPSF